MEGRREGGACRAMLGSDWWRDGSIVLFVQSFRAVTGSTSGYLVAIRRVCSCNVSTTPPGYQSFQPELTVDSRLQVKMNSLDCTRSNSAEKEEPKDQQDLCKL